SGRSSSAEPKGTKSSTPTPAWCCCGRANMLPRGPRVGKKNAPLPAHHGRAAEPASGQGATPSSWHPPAPPGPVPVAPVRLRPAGQGVRARRLPRPAVSGVESGKGLADVYASAGVALDLHGSAEKVLAVWAVSVREFYASDAVRENPEH